MASLRALADALAERLDGLSARLEELGTGLTDAIARVVSGAAGEAARAAARALLDRLTGGAAGPPAPPPWPGRADDDDYWYGRDPAGWSDDAPAGPRRLDPPDPGRTRRRLLVAGAWRAALSRCRARRWWPAALAAAAAVAAGLLAAPAGPALAAGAAAVAAALVHLAVSDLARRAVAAVLRLAVPSH